MYDDIKLAEESFVVSRRKTDRDEIFPLEHRAFYERRLIEHERHRFVRSHACPVDFRDLAPGEAARVQEFLPLERLCPAFQHFLVEPV